MTSLNHVTLLICPTSDNFPFIKNYFLKKNHIDTNQQPKIQSDLMRWLKRWLSYTKMQLGNLFPIPKMLMMLYKRDTSCIARFHSRPGIDYSATFSPVVKASTIHIVHSLAMHNKW
uniref:Reverse transcriptase Ty1/copia-type domain-containing protein n=1 Tax=Lactuca sativa TaxID=4236 RepID=A0A9R1UN06_LACSA|nr:hypothetical protein LSAT_V11C800440800 [Lactuca sativa]